MKKILITIILLLSCIGVFSQTTINPSGTWTAARNIINANFSDAYDSLAVHQLRLSAVDDSIASHLLRLIAVEDSIGELRISIGSGTGAEVDSSIYATRYYTSSTFATIANPVFTGVQKVSTTDTLATQAYARSYGGTGTVTVGDVRDEIADSLNALRPAMLVGDGTVGPFFDGSEDGGQMLYFYGDNGFYTALQGGAPTANRSYRLPIAALPSAGTTSLLNIDEYGNMGFIASTTYSAASHNQAQSTITALSDSLLARYTKTQANTLLNAKANLNSPTFTGTVGGITATMVGLGNVTNESKSTMFTSPTFTGTIPKYSTTDTLSTRAYSRSVGGGSMNETTVAGMINDSLDNRIGAGVELSDIAVMKADSTGGPGHYASWYDMTTGLANSSNWNTAYSERLRWDGGSTGLTATTGRTSLGATTIGSSLFTLANPSAITFPRFNADNTVTALSAANFKTALSLTSSDVGLGNVTNESKATMFTSPTFTGTLPRYSTTDTLATRAYARTYSGNGTVTESDVEDLITLNARLNIDTIPLFVFGAGGGLVRDTATFQNNVIAGAFYNAGADTLHITSIRGVLAEGSGTETISVQISWHATFKSGSAVNLNSSALAITSITTGDEDTSFANNEIPPNVWVWCTLSGASANNKPSMLSLTMTGYKIRNW